ncbi:hypothetical protein PCYB_012340 [Plasmodium cynomolgi strain B]|uniref:Uncharacterized protein n=1 Tax=Plasmodium cynomolgi (strain B) TaxID=1120755 RepID=K6UCA3_PLACD|nr:hypothetical protein PCYB_012340 [Plasmodium cynomolgi strain B]GAB64501.1 hypothetical protein PCYB_012340 [Plasmodium cynomolgi strain B]
MKHLARKLKGVYPNGKNAELLTWESKKEEAVGMEAVSEGEDIDLHGDNHMTLPPQNANHPSSGSIIRGTSPIGAFPLCAENNHTSVTHPGHSNGQQIGVLFEEEKKNYQLVRENSGEKQPNGTPMEEEAIVDESFDDLVKKKKHPISQVCKTYRQLNRRLRTLHEHNMVNRNFHLSKDPNRKKSVIIELYLLCISQTERSHRRVEKWKRQVTRLAGALRGVDYLPSFIRMNSRPTITYRWRDYIQIKSDLDPLRDYKNEQTNQEILPMMEIIALPYDTFFRNVDERRGSQTKPSRRFHLEMKKFCATYRYPEDGDEGKGHPTEGLKSRERNKTFSWCPG